jgi:F-type H+-transporting ATPase subunit epsilon
MFDAGHDAGGCKVKSFTLDLCDTIREEQIAGVVSFVGEDATGSFGILPGHARFMTVMGFSLARFRVGEGAWQYVALPGGLVYFAGDRLRVTTRRYYRGDDYGRISQELHEQMLAEEARWASVKESLHRLEEALFQRMWEMRREF